MELDNILCIAFRRRAWADGRGDTYTGWITRLLTEGSLLLFAIFSFLFCFSFFSFFLSIPLTPTFHLERCTINGAWTVQAAVGPVNGRWGHSEQQGNRQTAGPGHWMLPKD